MLHVHAAALQVHRVLAEGGIAPIGDGLPVHHLTVPVLKEAKRAGEVEGLLRLGGAVFQADN
jgi:hypothetical protein